MLYRITLWGVIVSVFAVSFAARSRFAEKRPEDACWGTVSRPCPTIMERSGDRSITATRRIISLSPSITEILYRLGLQDRIAGLTRDCKYPPEVEEIKKRGDIGGYYDLNFEALVALRPDLVILLKEHSNWLPAFEKLNIPALVVSHQTTEGIVESFGTIGRACGKAAEGEAMQRDFRRRIDRIREETARFSHPRVLFVLDRVYGCGHLADAYVAADDDYLDTIIRWAGGQNAYHERGIRYPVVSAEGVSWLNPDVIVDLVPPDVLRQLGREAILKDWNQLRGVKAVNEHRVVVPDKDYAYVPGPRFLELVEYLAREIHEKK
jgi:iron complex transport system substrate-binding protein